MKKSVKKENMAIKPDEAVLEEEELAAVLMAAISAYEADMGNQGERLIIRRITRLGGNPWATAGLSECTDSRRR